MSALYNLLCIGQDGTLYCGGYKVLHQQTFYGRRVVGILEADVVGKINPEIINWDYTKAKVLRSMVQEYRAIYFIILDTDEYSIIYPDGDEKNTMERFSERLARKLDEGTIDSECRDTALANLDLQSIKDRLAVSKCAECRYRRMSPEGVYEWCLVSVMPAEMDETGVVSVTMTIRSIDKFVRQEEAQKKRLEIEANRAFEANKAKRDFLSCISHEIRTPMNSIIGMTAVAKLHMDDRERVSDYLNKITISGRHLLGLINEVLDISNIESGHLTLIESEFDIGEALRGIIELFDEEKENGRAMLCVEEMKLIHRHVIGDEHRFGQILINLLGNSFKYTPPAGKVEIKVTEIKSEVCGIAEYNICIKDNGIGMDKEFVRRIFEPFSREDNKVTKETEGCGLGMMISRNIARMMNGDIEVESEAGKGTTFGITVKFRIAPDRCDSVCDQSLKIETYRNLDYGGKRVLLVEDNEFNAEVMQELLGEVGVEVEIADSGENAIRILREKEQGYYNLIFMDIRMPGINGYETTRRIRKSDREDLQNMPVIAMTAEAFSNDVREAVNAGMNGHVAKPVELDRLKEVLDYWLGAQ